MADPTPVSSVPLSAREAAQLAALERGDEATFKALVEQYHGSMVRIAALYVADRATAEEVAQEAWLGILRGLGRFERRSSLKTWIFSIVSNLARTRGKRERRTLPFSFFENYDLDTDDPAVPQGRFRPADAAYAHHWQEPPADWRIDPENRALNRELGTYLKAAVDALPEQQRIVISLRDIEGWSAGEVCNVLRIAETNQRVLLHRARSKVRRALEAYFQQ